jgi:3-hydroxyisobutyrate dehydrogenase/glyoxylate/succinic semialdehyde reductase
MGERIVPTGGNGTGTSMKMVINLLLGTSMAAFAEAMALGEGLGLAPKLLFDSLLGTPAVAPFLAAKRTNIEHRDYHADFPLGWMQKDMHLASVSAYEARVPMLLTNVAKEMYSQAMRGGHAAEDFSAIYTAVNQPAASANAWTMS